MIHDPVERDHDKYSSILSVRLLSTSRNEWQAVKLDFLYTNWNQSCLKY